MKREKHTNKMMDFALNPRAKILGMDSVTKQTEIGTATYKTYIVYQDGELVEMNNNIVPKPGTHIGYNRFSYSNNFQSDGKWVGCMEDLKYSRFADLILRLRYKIQKRARIGEKAVDASKIRAAYEIVNYPTKLESGSCWYRLRGFGDMLFVPEFGKGYGCFAGLNKGVSGPLTSAEHNMLLDLLTKAYRARTSK